MKNILVSLEEKTKAQKAEITQLIAKISEYKAKITALKKSQPAVQSFTLFSTSWFGKIKKVFTSLFSSLIPSMFT